MEYKTGMQLFHRGQPVELKTLMHLGCDFEVWVVLPLFVANPQPRPEIFMASDHCTFLHTGRR